MADVSTTDPGGYFGELRANLRPLAAAAIGTGSGLMVAAYTTAIFSRDLIATFHWSKAQFSLIGLTMFSTLLIMPLIGRLTDRFGVRPVATFGALTLPLCFVGYSLQTGPFWMFLAISASVLACGSTGTPAVWCRLIAENFHRSRGLALFIVTTMPALVGAALPRLLLWVNGQWGWRVGYRVLAVYFLVGGLTAVWLLPAREKGLDHDTAGLLADRTAKRSGAFREIVRRPVFWVITGAMMLCVLPTQLHAAQMMLMLGDSGLSPAAGADAISAFALGSILGRAACGLALDRFAPARVAALSMILPALGYLIIATHHGQVPVVTTAMLMIGLAYGAENDLPSFLVAHYFRVEVFSSAMSLVFCGILFSSASGALILALVLRHTESFTPFLFIVSGAVFAGSLLFLLLPRRGRPVRDEPAPEVPAKEVLA